MSNTDVIIAPQRAEVIIEEGGIASLRFIKFLESLQTNQNVISTELGTTILVTTSTYTSVVPSTLICTVPTTITLNAAPNDAETVNIHRGNGLVTIEGGGKLMNGETTIIINTDFTTLDFYYSSGTDSWIII